VRIVLLGPPGAGKGTQAVRLADKLGVPQISTGDLFRHNISTGTELGVKAKAYLDAGDLVPAELTNALVDDRLNDEDVTAGFILDGFPRTLVQADATEAMLRAKGLGLSVVIEFRVDDDELIRRVAGRYSCAQCGSVYHDTDKVPAAEGVCDKCGSTHFKRRPDDTPETMTARLQVYYKETSPLIGYYHAKGKLKSVDGMAEIDQVTAEVESILSKL